jgi:S-adenosylmethionine-diacylglycerol 3-amino-3-carboxypropyl transferase
MSEIYFAQVREDSRLERTVVERRSPSRIVCVGSGGCTALSLLSSGVEIVHCVDSNPAQCALIELKKAALAKLDREGCLDFLGERPGDDRLGTYQRHMAPLLPRYAREYWDARPGDVLSGVNQCGATERFYRFVGTNLRKSVCPDEVWRRLFSCRSIAEQVELFDRHFTTESWHAAVRVLLSKTTHLAFFPAFMFAEAKEHDFGAFFASQFELEVRNRPMRDNYFLSQFLFGSYLLDEPEGTPHYLSRAGYESTRQNVDKLVVVPKPLEEFLLEANRVDAFFLSNVFDWMAPAARARLCELVLRAGSKRACLLYRNMFSAHPLPTFFTERFAHCHELSAELVDLERSMMYRRIAVGELS